MTARQIEKLLEAQRLPRRSRPTGRPCDPTVHDAILQQPVADVSPGTIVGTAVRSYKLHDRVVRPAQVIVAKEPWIKELPECPPMIMCVMDAATPSSCFSR